MSTETPESPVDRVSKVTFSPVSDSSGNQSLVVTIKTVAPQPEDFEDISRILRRSRRSMSFDSSTKASSDVKRRTRSKTLCTTKSMMTEKGKTSASDHETTPTSSRQSADADSPAASSPKSVPELPPSFADTPCLKHAAENITRKASAMESGSVSMCSNCSKSMLSYIFVVQDFLDSLAKKIVGNSNPNSCVQCLRSESRIYMSDHKREDDKTVRLREKNISKSRIKEEKSSYTESPSSSGKPKRNKETREIRRYEETSEQMIERSPFQHKQVHYQNSHQTHIPNPHENIASCRDPELSQNFQLDPSQVSYRRAEKDIGFKGDNQNSNTNPQEVHEGHPQEVHEGHQLKQEQNPFESKPFESHPSQDGQQDYLSKSSILQTHSFTRQMQSINRHNQIERDVESGISFSDGVDGIVSTLSTAEREIYDSARNGAGWEGLVEAQERLVSSLSRPIPREAYVTMCRNNAEALGCLVVGTSLLLTRTTRTLCVLVSEGVSNSFRSPLSSVFHVVQCSRSLDDPLATTKLSLLEQPEVGVSFEKLNLWRLLQFDKCVFLGPDTLVMQNCDELFCRDELSAVSDVGWPDCFNDGLFVFVPSLDTFWRLIEHAESNGTHDGGDQGLLNSYFNSWSLDIRKKLSFIYNLMANVSYTYAPAFKQFGRNVKVVQFHGPSKPWHVKFFSRTGNLSPESPVHPTFAQFVHVWINIFRVGVLRQMPQEVRSYAQSQEVLSAVELLRFFQPPSKSSQAEFFLTPPSVRMHHPTSTPARGIHRRKSAPDFPTRPAPDVRERDVLLPAPDVSERDVQRTAADVDVGERDTQRLASDVCVDIDAESDVIPVVQTTEKSTREEISLPGSEVGNYQGMKAWEQGRMDYQGTDSSDTIIKRLEFLMSKPK